MKYHFGFQLLLLIAYYFFIVPFHTAVLSKPVEPPIHYYTSNQNKKREDRYRSPVTDNPETKTSKATKLRENIIAFDLSGRVQCLLVGTKENSNVQALFIPTENQPAIYATADYDFQKRQQGVTKVGTMFQWNTKTPTSSSSSSITPCTVAIQLDNDLGTSCPIDSTSLSLDWNHADQHAGDHRHHQRPAFTLRWDQSEKSACLHWFLPINQRFQIYYKSHLLCDELLATPKGYFQSRLAPPREPHKSDDWWIPDIRMNTMGHISSENRFYRTVAGRNQVGIRLAFRRKLAFGSMADEEDDLCTHVQIDVTTMDQHRQNSMTTTRVESILESMLASIRVAILHEHAISIPGFHRGSR